MSGTTGRRDDERADAQRPPFEALRLRVPRNLQQVPEHLGPPLRAQRGGGVSHIAGTTGCDNFLVQEGQDSAISEVLSCPFGAGKGGSTLRAL